MFDFLKNLTKSDEEKQREAFSAYLDDTLSPSQRREFEAMLAEDADLRAEMELAQALRQQMRELPRRSVPRSFTLNPSVYKAPKKEPLVQAYPFLRAATVMTAFFFVMALGLSVFTTQGGNDMASVAQSAMEPTPAFEAPMADAEIAMEEAAEEPVAEEIVVEEIVVEEIVVEEIVVDGEAADETARAMPEEAAPRPTLAIAMTKSTEMQLELEQEEGLMEADDMANAAASSGAAAPPTATPLSTATVSALPRLEATATAVPRAIEPTAIPPGEIAKAEESETAVNETHPTPQQLPSRSPSTSQLLLIGLGILLLVLVVVTLLARRKI